MLGPLVPAKHEGTDTGASGLLLTGHGPGQAQDPLPAVSPEGPSPEATEWTLATTNVKKSQRRKSSEGMGRDNGNWL